MQNQYIIVEKSENKKSFAPVLFSEIFNKKAEAKKEKKYLQEKNKKYSFKIKKI